MPFLYRYRKMRTAQRLTPFHKQRRLEFCRNNMNTEWHKVWFSDEKRFNLDGCDGFLYYWHDLRREERIFSKRQGGGGGLMVWAAITKEKKSEIRFVNGTLTSQKYTEILRDTFLPIASVGELFQQDNATPHVSEHTTTWMNEHGMEVLEWPSASPDFNPIENVWALLARAVYRDGRQFQSLPELRKAVEVEWRNLGQHLIAAIVGSMPDRIFRCIQHNGSHF